MPAENKRTVPSIRKMKGKEPIVCLTAYDKPFAYLADQAGCDVILVGDSLGNVVLGYSTTVPVELWQMVHHTKAAATGIRRALLIADMPFGSYGSSTAQGIDSAVALMKAGAEAVKLEGDFPELVEALVRIGIPVMGHIGLTPQSVNQFGGFKVQGKSEAAGMALRDQVSRAEQAGAFAVVLELLPTDLAANITANTTMVTIGIGAGKGCDGQIQVIHDILGFGGKPLRHSKTFGDVAQATQNAISDFAAAIRAGQFPGPENEF